MGVSQKRMVTIDILNIDCRHSEEEKWGDEFFIVGIVTTTEKSARRRNIVGTTPFTIKSGERKDFPTKDGRLYHDYVEIDDRLEMGLTFVDDDNIAGSNVTKAASKLTQLVGSIAYGSPVGKFAAEVVNEAPEVLQNILGDKDDILGSVNKVITMGNPDAQEGDNGPYAWHFTKDHPNIVERVSDKDLGSRSDITSPPIHVTQHGPPSWSYWNYTLTYRISVGRIEKRHPTR